MCARCRAHAPDVFLARKGLAARQLVPKIYAGNDVLFISGVWFCCLRHALLAVAARAYLRRSQCHAVLMMLSRSECAGVQPSSALARAGLATRLGGSPARRG